LNTEKTYSEHADAKVEWEEARFEMQPVAAVTTLLSKSQADVRNLQGDVVTFLKSMVDADDFRVNKIQAQIIPVSQYVTQGDKYKAQIILSASDSTKQPEVYVGGTKISEGKYEVTAGKIGESKFSGYIKMFKPDGTSIQYPFDGSYFTSAPSATISADKMNVFYAGIDNDISVSVPGYPSSLVTATISGAQLRTNPRGGYFVSGARAGVSCEITAYAKVDGKQKVMGKKTFRVKPLPPPIAFIPLNINGNYSKYKGSPDKIKKVNLLNVTELQAELNDADIEAHFEVVGFELNISSAMGSQILPSSSSKFTTEQLNYLKTVSSGKKFFIGNIRAIGPDKVVKPLPPMEVVIN
jgi:gliding motility-associated protein GldM